jgi:hypothetical protein
MSVSLAPSDGGSGGDAGVPRGSGVDAACVRRARRRHQRRANAQDELSAGDAAVSGSAVPSGGQVLALPCRPRRRWGPQVNAYALRRGLLEGAAAAAAATAGGEGATHADDDSHEEDEEADEDDEEQEQLQDAAPPPPPVDLGRLSQVRLAQPTKRNRSLVSFVRTSS